MFIHRIDPQIGQLGGIELWYYGACYAWGFLGVYAWLRWKRTEVGWSRSDVLECSICFAAGILLIGRLFEVVVYEWPLYREHPEWLFSYGRGGMASHGVLLGGVGGLWLFCFLRKKSFLTAADEIAVPSAFLLALGRLGNFINGEIFGPVSEVWWAVQFPFAEGFRHPVTLYESAKNLAVLGILLIVRRKSKPGEGLLLAHFVLWYGALRIFTDLYRSYGAEFLGIGRGQYYNALMAALGVVLLVVYTRKKRKRETLEPPALSASKLTETHVRLWPRRLLFSSLLMLSLTIPSGWSLDWLAARRTETATTVPEPHDAGLLVPRSARR